MHDDARQQGSWIFMFGPACSSQCLEKERPISSLQISQAVASGVTRPFEVPPCVIFAAAASEREWLVMVKVLDPKPTDGGLLSSHYKNIQKPSIYPPLPTIDQGALFWTVSSPPISGPWLGEMGPQVAWSASRNWPTVKEKINQRLCRGASPH